MTADPAAHRPRRLPLRRRRARERRRQPHQPHAAAPLAACDRRADRGLRGIRAAHRARRRALHRARQEGRPPGARLPAAVSPVPGARARDRAHAQPRRARGRGAGVGGRRAGAHPRRARLGHAGPGRQRRRYRHVRRLYRPFVSRYVALSRHLEEYLEQHVGVPADRVSQIYNGVDTERFRPSREGVLPIPGCPFGDPETVARWDGRPHGSGQGPAQPCARIRARPAARPCRGAALRLVLVGDGAMRAEVQQILARRPALRSAPGSPASATTFPASCAGSTASCCRRSPRASRTRSSKRWRAACRSSRRASAATRSWSSPG